MSTVNIAYDLSTKNSGLNPSATILVTDDGSGNLTAINANNPLPITGGGSTPTGTSTQQTLYYSANVAFTSGSVNVSVGDILQEIITTSSTGVKTSAWYDQTQNNAILTTAPSLTNLTFLPATPLTFSQLNSAGLGKDTTLNQILLAIQGWGGGTAVIDSATPTPTLFWMVVPENSSPVYYLFGTFKIGTPVLPVKPYTYDVGSVIVSNFPTTQAVSGTVTANAGTNLNTSALALETGGNLAAINSKIPAQGQALAAGSLPVVLPASQITALTPPTTVAITSTTSGSATGGTAATQSTLFGGTYNTTAPTLTNGQQSAIQLDANGNLKTSLTGATYTGSGYLNVNVGSSTFSYSTSNSTNGNSTSYSLANGATWNGTLENTINQTYLIIGVNSTQNVTLNVYQYIDNAGTILEVPTKSFSVTGGTPFNTSIAVEGNYVKATVTNSSGSTSTLYVDSYYGSLPSQPDSLTQAGNFKVAIQESLPSGANLIGNVKITDGTNIAAITAASTAATATQSAQVVALSPNSPIPAGTNAIGSVTLGAGSNTIGNVNLYQSGSAVSATNPIAVQGNSLRTIVTPTLTATTAYSAGQVVGGIMSFPILRTGKNSGILSDIALNFKGSVQPGTFAAYVFDKLPTGTYTDHAAPTFNAADSANLMCVIPLNVGYSGLGTMTNFNSPGIGVSIQNNDTTQTNNVYIVLIASSASAALGSTADLSVNLGILGD